MVYKSMLAILKSYNCNLLQKSYHFLTLDWSILFKELKVYKNKDLNISELITL